MMRTLYLILAFCAACTFGHAQKIFTSPEVAKTAAWAKMPYKKSLKKAAKGDRKAIVEMMQLFSVLEANESKLHGRTVFELLNHVGDSVFSHAIFTTADRKYWPVLQKCLPAGQALVADKRLRETPVGSLFPVTWAVAKDDLVVYQNFHCPSCRAKDGNGTSSISDAVPQTKDKKDKKHQSTLSGDAPKQPEAVPPTSDGAKSDAKRSDDVPSNEIDPKLLERMPKKVDRPLPPDVEKKIDEIIKAQGGGK